MAAKKPAKVAKVKKTQGVVKKKTSAPVSTLRAAAKVLAKKVAGSLTKPKAIPSKKVPAPLPKKIAPAPVKGKAEGKLPAKAAAKIPPVVAKSPKAPLAAKNGKQESKAPSLAPLVKPDTKQAKGKTTTKGKGELLAEIPQPKGLKVIKSKASKGDEFTLANGKRRCREPGCDLEGFLGGYCRLHYIKNWKKVKRKELILASGQLNNYVEELVSKYPDKYLEVIRQDLSSEKDWSKVVEDLELDSSVDDAAAGDDDLDGVPESPRRAPGAEREFEDDGDSF